MKAINQIAVVLFIILLNAPGNPATLSDEDLRAGRNFIQTRIYSTEEDERILKLFEGLRVADVCDGMDAVGLKDIGLMSSDIHPLWRDTSNFTHRIVGIAITARYIPTQLPTPTGITTEQYDKWAADWYKNRSSEPFTQIIRKGSVVVIEEAPDCDVGSIGSNNIMSWKLKGCVGVITSGTARDTDEIILERIPLYFKKPGRGIRPGRNEIESVNRPIVCGGVTVMPGDVIVADGDGVIVVPRERAEEVAVYARKILNGDKAARLKLYDKLGIPADNSVK
ncbi:MAG: RraA family protein [Verrucomicrobiia bacterium]|jgi:regulator of RNase E activity RraA